MIEDLNEKLLGHTPVTRKELFELVSSHGRNFGITSFCEYDNNKTTIYYISPSSLSAYNHFDASSNHNQRDY